MTRLTIDDAGFRLRGRETTRTETFTDAAFAFALTLLVISLDPPTGMAEFYRALRDVPAFVVSAALLLLFWWGHHEWSRRYGMDDGATALLSALLVVTVLVFVYPLRFMSMTFFSWIGWISGLPVGSRRFAIDSVADVNAMLTLYSAGFAAMAATILLLTVHAWRSRAMLELNALEEMETRAALVAWSVMCGTGVLATVTGLLAPPSLPGAPGWVFMILPVFHLMYSRRMKRLRSASQELMRGS